MELARTDAHEGPVYVPAEDALYFTTRAGAVRRLAGGEVVEVPAEVVRANGVALDHDGSLLICQQGSFGDPAAIRRYADGVTTTVVDSWRGLSLNSPNDVVVKSDGTIWFTDPSYGFLQGFRPEPQLGDHVYRLDPAQGRARSGGRRFRQAERPRASRRTSPCSTSATARPRTTSSPSTSSRAAGSGLRACSR